MCGRSEPIVSSVTRASRLGAKTLVPPMDALGVGRFSGLVSPQGVVFWVFEYAR